ncbi:MAG: acyltransferase family protein [Candidatus Promineifilaceae bacterium]|nr:acyltransferase family protein [Candidatus Promineifilaceae bacterium]
MAPEAGPGNSEQAAPAAGQAAIVAQPTRLYYLDWIRVLAILGVFLYHASRPFMLQEWLINDQQQSAGLTFIFLIFLGSFGMPLFFLVAGSGSYFAQRRRTAAQFARERLHRLLVPFVAGCLLLSPIQFYLEWLHKGRYQGSFWSFLPVLVADRYQTIGQRLSPTLFEALGSHLWFLGFLLAFSLLTLPLFRWLGRPVGRRMVAGLGRLAERRGGLFPFVLPVILARIVLQGQYGGYTDWADFTYMLLFFVSGYILYADSRMTAAIRRDGPLAFGAGLLCTVTMLLLLFFGPGRQWVEAPNTAGFYVAWALVTINGWCWTMFVLWLGMSFFDRPHRGLTYGQDIIVPFFVCHQPFIVAVTFFTVAWSAPVALKHVLIVLVSLVATLLLIELVVRRVTALRAVFGMKTHRAQSAV